MGTNWKAILSPIATEADNQLSASTASQPAPVLLEQPTVSLPAGKFLDAQQRYQLLEPLPQQISCTVEVETRVLDCQPLQPSAAQLYQQQVNRPLGLETLAELAIPAIAQAYWELQAQFPLLALPHLHDAWQQERLNILLLEDRSAFPLLVDLWLDDAVQPLQILHWLHEMAELWTVLEPYGGCRSLLELSNLRVDEDQLLCLQRLYFDRPQQPTTLADLGQLWQKLFQQSQRTHHADIARLCAALIAGEVATPAGLQTQIEAIASTLQSGADSLNVMALDSSVDSSVDSSADSSVDAPQPQPAQPVQPAQPDRTAVEGSRTVPNPAQMPLDSQPLNLPDDRADADAEITLDLKQTAPPDQPSVLPVDLEPPTVDEDEGEGDDQPTVVLGMQLISLEDAGQTDIGRQRNHNEDCFSLQTELKKLEGLQGRALQAKGLYILCDGMGGHASGEVASAIAVATLRQYFAEHWQDKLPSEAQIRQGIQQANRVIFELNQKNASAGSGRMGTTLVLLLVHNTEAAIAHVGDSRLYRLNRRQNLLQLTVDHEVGQREIQRGVEPAIAYGRPDAYQLTQALGPRDENFLSPDIKFMELNEDGVFLLCSDGLSDNDLLETHWSTHLEPMLDYRTNLEQGISQLIDLANQQNGHDNITAIAVRVRVRPNLDQLPR
jgi:protein phosphatase